MAKMKIGFIVRHNLEMNPQFTEKFQFMEASYTRRITPRGDKIYTKILMHPVDYEEVVDNTNIIKESPSLMLVAEPFFLDEELRERATKWVEWANKTDPKVYDPFAK